MNDYKLYTLKEKKSSGELHLFRAKPNNNNDACTPKSNSICSGMKNSESIKIIFACSSKDYARTECAKIGEAVCGNCVKSLYKTYS